jgi:hypothetical protein
MEIMPEIRDAIMNKYTGKWIELAMEQLKTTYSGGEMDKSDRGLKALAELYSGDALAALVADQEMSPDDRRGRLIRASMAAYVNGNELTSIVKYQYDVDASRPAPQTTSGGMFERYKLTRGSGGGDSRPVPSDGTVLTTLIFEDGSIVEARSDPLSLPGQPFTWTGSSESLNVEISIDEVRSCNVVRDGWFCLRSP